MHLIVQLTGFIHITHWQ